MMLEQIKIVPRICLRETPKEKMATSSLVFLSLLMLKSDAIRQEMGRILEIKLGSSKM